MDMRAPGDFAMMQDGMRESAGLAEEPILLRRYLATVAGDKALGEADSITYTDIPTTALISSMKARDINYPGSIYVIGDLSIQCRAEIRGAESFAREGNEAGRPTDKILYNGREYRVVGPVNNQFHGGTQFWEAVMRQT